MVKSRNIGQIKLATQYPIRIGARDGDQRRFAGKISCLQIYNKALDEQQIGNLKSCPVKGMTHVMLFICRYDAAKFQICPRLNGNEIQIPYDKHHKVSSLVKSHLNTHNSVKYEVA